MSSIQPESSVPTFLSSTVNQPEKRQPRGKINHRACQKCRNLKIKCDGDAENNISCSNCDYGTCVYEESPRKKRKIEILNTKIKHPEKDVEVVRNDCTNVTNVTNVIEILKLEKQILNLLIEYSSLFADHPMIFNQLRQAINESRCLFSLLQIIHELLLRLSQSDGNDTNSIIETLKRVAESIMNYCNPNDAFNPNIQNISNNQQLFSTTNPTTINPITGEVSTSMTTGMVNLTLHSPGSEVGSDMGSLSIPPDFKHDLTSPLLSSIPNKIEINSPHLTSSIDEVGYYSGSKYANSPVNISNEFPYFQQTYLDDYKVYKNKVNF